MYFDYMFNWFLKSQGNQNRITCIVDINMEKKYTELYYKP